ncbi:hypothetical protein K458DRAFT_296041 [Lentithecium fluviatile CBS 122367]|uniref:Zn(2)-C6 fungal-type domain-containing protein n=1 Tax=Lentithecium fluviatile CBS 122367 TaxID=1168545 RepID=A0A6G1JB18_9PLEO|nr:hypothetical protein K458DRAFT_296041 [Lentithecium fluviatile CBS 122367]
MYKAPARKTVSQACDACRRRKIKCNGLHPCPGCISANLSCTFDVPQKRGGNRGARATVLNELRAGQQQDEDTSVGDSQTETTMSTHQGASQSPRDLAGGLEAITIDACIETYLRRIQPVVPLLTPDILREEASQTSMSLLSRQFIISFCAYVVTFSKILDDPLFPAAQTPEGDLGERLLEAALRIQNSERVTKPSRLSVYISFFLYGAHAGLGDYRQGWFYLREATTLFMIQKAGGEWYEVTAYRCLFWVLVISERAHGIRRNRPITLQVTHSSPALDDPSERGLQYLAAIFRPFDEVFFAVWNGSRLECNKDWLLGLERDVRTALPPILDVSNEQIANLRVSQLWLQIKLWELFPRFGFLSSESVYECLTFRYPTVVAKDLTILAMKLPIASFQIHGVGMTEKIFDIACALADILPFISTSASHFELGPIDYLTQTASLLAKLPDGSAKFVPLLLTKVNELLPELVKTLCEIVQLPVMALNDPMSPDTRFVYEEEVGRGLYLDLRRGR